MVTQNFFAKRIGTGTREDPYRPTGADTLNSLGVTFQNYFFAFSEWHLVRIEDTTQQVLTDYAALTDTRPIPQNLRGTISNQTQLDNTVAVLDELHIPNDWVTIGMTWEEVLRVVWLMFSLFARLQERFRSQVIFDYFTTTNLNLAWNQHPQGFRDAMRAAANSLGFDDSSVRNADSLKRAIWKTAQNGTQLPWGGN